MLIQLYQSGIRLRIIPIRIKLDTCESSKFCEKKFFILRAATNIVQEFPPISVIEKSSYFKCNVKILLQILNENL